MDASAGSKATAVHVLVFPFPAQGHVTSMLKFAELLSLAGLRVTFVNTDHTDAHLRCFCAAYARLSLKHGFHFRTIPDGLDDDIDSRSASNAMKLEESLRGPRAMASFKEILVEHGSQSVTCALIDGMLVRPIEIAEGLGIPTVVFCTSNSCSFWANFCIPNLIQSGEIPIPDDADMDELIRSVPGMEGMLRRRDLPSFIRRARTIDEPVLQFFSSVTAATTRARGLIFNTIESLEASALAHIRSHCPNTYTLGPIHLLNAHTTDKRDLSCSLWQEDRSCMSWLDSQENRSVVYVSFGSFTVVSPDELLEFWHGLVGSGYQFLWVLRPGMGSDGLPPPPPPDELTEAARERGCIVGWAPQGEVLAHPAVGCFVTHSGWNSTLESMAAGVPMVCWPFFADQQINSRFVSEVWGVGLDMKDRCRREVVEKMVSAAMEGVEIRRAAAEMAETARRAVEEGGSSECDFRRLVRDIESLSLMARVPN